MNNKTTQVFKSNLLWKVLAYFLRYPSSEAYVKELARRLKIGPTSANTALRTLENIGLLQRQEKARSHFYSLNNKSAVVKSLKVAYVLARLEEVDVCGKLLGIDEGLISLCIYGSYSNGTFDEKSDLDILIISQKEKIVFDSVVAKLENLLKLEINIEVFSLAKWKRLKEEDKGFHQEVLMSNILLYGSELT